MKENYSLSVNKQGPESKSSCRAPSGCASAHFESARSTERRDDTKLLQKLKNDMGLLQEILDEEKAKNERLQHQLDLYGNLVKSQKNQDDLYEEN